MSQERRAQRKTLPDHQCHRSQDPTEPVDCLVEWETAGGNPISTAPNKIAPPMLTTQTTKTIPLPFKMIHITGSPVGETRTNIFIEL